jgi:hypothetical protein
LYVEDAAINLQLTTVTTVLEMMHIKRKELASHQTDGNEGSVYMLYWDFCKIRGIYPTGKRKIKLLSFTRLPSNLVEHMVGCKKHDDMTNFLRVKLRHR